MTFKGVWPGRRRHPSEFHRLAVHNPFPNHSLFCRRQKLLKHSDLAIPV
jgi:IS5 family transposase